METNHEHFINRSSERGNALVYVLIAIALFAALSFTMGRQTDTGEAGTLDSEKAEIYATELLTYASQARSVIDQMTLSGTEVDNLVFTKPNAAGFNTGSSIHKVYHPDGGGLSDKPIMPAFADQTSASPAAGWYMGLFNNVEWTQSSATDVMLTAFQISKPICEKINLKITGSAAIPVVSVALRDVLVAQSFHAGTNEEFNSADCADCEKYHSLCVSDSGATQFAFYNILVPR
jgi:hypothetical protein